MKSLVLIIAVKIHAAATTHCVQQMVQIQLFLAPYNIATWLCTNGQINVQDQTVHVTISGITADHNYWHFPNQSYVDYLVQTGGYVVFNFDRLGVGLSDRPIIGTLITADIHAEVLSQLVKYLKQQLKFPKIVLVGHSLGSLTIWTYASNYKNADIDGIIITGLLHNYNFTSLFSFGLDLYIANLDSKFSYLPLDYLTTIPNTRVNYLFYSTNADPYAIALDEQLKETGTLGELALGIFKFSASVSLSINVPVLVVIGQKDIEYCQQDYAVSCENSGIVLQRETPFYSTNTCLETYVQTESAHAINLHRNAQDWYQMAVNWSNRRIGKTWNSSATQPC
ncbi:unnamed protein product [Didymodactylos carnosus]|uniref:AB hydrolase-1 domain-containing protein n=1 Tax=Didymodactylos carnosus TaxID=1234261 RepID=A0A814NQ38_9BILA|nr:unnamed protein product [Didymodactylos carnosus]CAF1096258.1 unnamed protein product [Didymodactylos carnosus]CAF3718973.1 unnamed protein product [Didymodactylos carnosus]CAF3861543.1 unnamed protein product [Didymodactylos carnosus]